jgi:hypothetical protein
VIISDLMWSAIIGGQVRAEVGTDNFTETFVRPASKRAANLPKAFC